MATPNATPTPPRKERTKTLVSMVNQVTLEGYLVRAWIHEPYRYLRLANQRPPERGGQTGGRVPIESDYVTVRLDPSVPFDMQDARRGLHLLVHGRMEGRNIPETIGEILSHCTVHIGLPREITSIQVSRPSVQICCTTLEFRYPHLPEAGRSDRNRDHRERRSQEVVVQPAWINGAAQASSEPTEEGIQPGEDAAETAALIDTRQAPSGSDRVSEASLDAEVISPPAEEGKKAAEKPEKKGKVKKK